MTKTARARRPVILGSAAALLLSALVVAPGAGAHPGHDSQVSAPGIGVILNPGTADEEFLPGFQYSGTPPVDGTEAEVVSVGNGCSPASYAGKDVEGKIALADRGDTSTPCPPSTFFQLVFYAEQAGASGLVVIPGLDGKGEPRQPSRGTAIRGGIPAMEVFRTPEILAAKDAAVSGAAVIAALADTRLPIPSSGPAECVNGVARSDDGLFEGEQVSGAEFDCTNVDLLSIVGKDVINSAGISDIWGWTDPMDGGEYVIMGKTNGTAFFNITDPTAPLYLGEIPNRSPVQAVWHDIKVYDNHAFIVSESEQHGMTVFDLTRLRGLEASDGTVQFEPDAVYELISAAHNLEINTETGFAYLVGGNSGLVAPDQCLQGLHMVNIQNPKNPTFAGCYTAEGGPGTAARSAARLLPAPVGGVNGIVEEASPAAYVHDTTCVVYDGPDTEHQGKEICLNSAERSVVIADVTNKQAPVTLGSTDYEKMAYTHQGSLTADHRFLIVNDELDEQTFGTNTRTIVLDVSDLDAPKLQYIHTHETKSIDHNNYVHEGFVYQSNYSSGLRVLDVADVESKLTEVAFFDTYPYHSDATFDGTWSNYPFFESGTVAISGREEGLFLVKVRDEALGRGGETQQPALEASCDNCPVEIRAGESGAVTLEVKNAGDGAQVEVTELPEGWTASSATASGDRTLADVTVDVPSRDQAGTYTLLATVTRASDGATATAELVVEVVKGKPSDKGPRG